MALPWPVLERSVIVLRSRDQTRFITCMLLQTVILLLGQLRLDFVVPTYQVLQQYLVSTWPIVAKHAPRAESKDFDRVLPEAPPMRCHRQRNMLDSTRTLPYYRYLDLQILSVLVGRRKRPPWRSYDTIMIAWLHFILQNANKKELLVTTRPSATLVDGPSSFQDGGETTGTRHRNKATKLNVFYYK